MTTKKRAKGRRKAGNKVPFNQATLPGSDAALDAGCRCPVLDNAHGKGWMGGGELYWISAACPLHGKREGKQP